MTKDIQILRRFKKHLVQELSEGLDVDGYIWLRLPTSKWCYWDLTNYSSEAFIANKPSK